MIKKSLAVVGLTLSLSANAATLNIVGGQLMGAYDVDVDGALYDVAFVDGTCIDLFNGCTDFTFTTEEGAIAAAMALSEQVFTGIPYGASPELTNGIEDISSGNIRTTYEVSGNFARAAYFQNYAIGGLDDYVATSLYPMIADSGNSASTVYAIWTAGAAALVPIPAAGWLFMSALLGLVGKKRLSRR